jgi:hypothetical protein
MRQEGVLRECDARLTGKEIGGFSAYHRVQARVRDEGL